MKKKREFSEFHVMEFGDPPPLLIQRMRNSVKRETWFCFTLSSLHIKVYISSIKLENKKKRKKRMKLDSVWVLESMKHDFFTSSRIYTPIHIQIFMFLRWEKKAQFLLTSRVSHSHHHTIHYTPCDDGAGFSVFFLSSRNVS